MNTPTDAATPAPTCGSSAEKPDLRLVASWDGDRLMFNDEAIRVVARSALSPSTAKAMSGCPSRWAADRLLPRHEDPLAAAPLGDAVHKIFEDLFALPYFKRSFDEAMRLLEAHKLRLWPAGDPATLAKRANWHGLVHQRMAGLWDIEDPRHVQVKAIEVGFTANSAVRGIPFVGYIDRLDHVTLPDGSEGVAIVDYKGLALDTPIPTPTGWSTMGELQVGDKVLGSDGTPTEVVLKSQVHHRPCYEIVFSDGARVVCDNVHLWQIEDRGAGPVPVTSVVDADTLFEMLCRRHDDGEYGTITVSNPSALDLPDADLPLDPRVTGVRLGSAGTSVDDVVPDVCGDDEIRNLYLRGSRTQRIALLQGLMDARGHWDAEFGGAGFVSTDEALMALVVELVASLGVSMVRPCGRRHLVAFYPTGVIPLEVPGVSTATEPALVPVHRTITSMRLAQPVPTQCIQVDALDSLYLCGPTMVPTHNTGKMPPRDKMKFYGDDHGDQMRLYDEALFNDTGVRPVKARLYYTAVGKSRDAAISRPYMSKTLDGFEVAWADLKRFESEASFPTKTGPLCGWCPLVNTCPAAKAAGLTDRTGNAAPEGSFRIPVARPLRVEVPTYVEEDFGSAADTVHEPDGSAHNKVSSTPPVAVEAAVGAMMSEHVFSEDKAWEPESRGLLNGNSFAATAVFGMVSLAYEEIVKADVALSKDALDGLSQTFAVMLRPTQHELSGSSSWMNGLNMRLRGLLRSFIETHPLPFGQDAAAWDAWVALGTKHIRTLALAAHRLYEADAPTTPPWAVLAAPSRPQAVTG